MDAAMTRDIAETPRVAAAPSSGGGGDVVGWKEGPMSAALIDKVAVRFRALSDPNRLLLLQHIVSGDRSVNELAVAAGLSLANTSKHLAQLCSAGFIARHKAGTKAIYTLASDTPRLLCDLVCRDVRSQVERDVATTSPREPS